MNVYFEKDQYAPDEVAYMVAEIENKSLGKIQAIKGNFIQELRVSGKKFKRNFVANLSNVRGKGVPAKTDLVGEDSMRLELKLVSFCGSNFSRITFV